MKHMTSSNKESANVRTKLAIIFAALSIVIPFVLQFAWTYGYNQTHGIEYASGWGFGVFFMMVGLVVLLGWPLAIAGLTLGIMSLKKDVKHKQLATMAIVIASAAIVLLPVLVLASSAIVGQPGSS